MDRLFIMDAQDYDPSLKRFRRPSARGIIIKDGRLAMVHSIQYNYYKFPGGGIKSGESPESALIREVTEETGLTVIPESVREFGSVLRIQLSAYDDQTIFEQENFYYLCDTKDMLQEQSLDDYESEEGFTLEYVLPETVIDVNKNAYHGGYDRHLIEREAKVTEYLLSKELI